MTSRGRSIALEVVKNECLAFAYSFKDTDFIDRNNILKSALIAMVEAVEKLIPQPDYLLVDGNQFIQCAYKYSTITRGDKKSLSIAAASIIAKTMRDDWMINVAHEKYPQYNLAQNKGYGTKEHFQAIDKYGICPLHRRTFLKKYFSRQIHIYE